jgi:ribosome-associated protein
MKADKIADNINQTLSDFNAQDIRTLDVRELTDITDYMLVGTATSNRHAKTLSDKVIEELEKHEVSLYHHEGYTLGKWILLDFTDVVVHIMQQEERDFYSLEKLWALTETSRAKTP